MSPQWGAINSYNLSYKGRRVCILKVNDDIFEIRVNTQYNQDFNDCFADAGQETKTLLEQSMTFCHGCGSCKPGLDMTILGKAYHNACYNPVIQLVNPDDLQLDLACKLVMLRRKAIAEGKAPAVTYIAKSKR